MGEHPPDILAAAERAGVVWDGDGHHTTSDDVRTDGPGWYDRDVCRVFAYGSTWHCDTAPDGTMDSDRWSRHSTELEALQALPPVLPAVLPDVDTSTWTLEQRVHEVVRRLRVVTEERDEARAKYDTVHHAWADDARLLQAEASALRARVGELEAERDQARADAKRLARELAEELKQPQSTLTGAEIAARCGLARYEPAPDNRYWRDRNGAVAVWKAEIGWNWDAGDGLHGKEMSAEAALLAYARARGVELDTSPAPDLARLTAERDEAIRIEAHLRARVCAALDRHGLMPGWGGDLVDRLERALAQLDPPSRRELRVWDAVLDALAAAELHDLHRVVRALVGAP